MILFLQLQTTPMLLLPPERQWNMWIPGFGSEEIRPYKKACTTEAHKQVRISSPLPPLPNNSHLSKMMLCEAEGSTVQIPPWLFLKKNHNACLNLS